MAGRRAVSDELLEELGLAPERDEAGNLWAWLDGGWPAWRSARTSIRCPDGGWLDGALGVMAALGVLRAWSPGAAALGRSR